MSHVPFVDLQRQHAPLTGELEEAFQRVLGSGGFVLGQEVERFEQAFAEYCDVEHCIGVASGTAALALAFTAAGIGPGDEVIVPAHTFIATALAVVHAGATPVFCDVEEGTGLIDAESAAAVCGERTAAIAPVHLYGQMCDMGAVIDLAERRGLAVIEDSAQAHGATWQGKRAGSVGTASGFSFYPSKNLGALGDGGAIATNDAELAARARQLRHLGQRAKGEHAVIGYNERLDGMQAAFLSAKLPHLDSWNATRRERAATLRETLGDAVGLLEERPETPCIYHLFPVRVPDRDALASRLADAGVQTGVHYSPAMPDHGAFAERYGSAVDAPVARRWAAEELSLPMFAEMTEEEAMRAGEAVRAAFALR